MKLLLKKIKNFWYEYTRCDGKGCVICGEGLTCEQRNDYPTEEDLAAFKKYKFGFEDEYEEISFLDIELPLCIPEKNNLQK